MAEVHEPPPCTSPRLACSNHHRHGKGVDRTWPLRLQQAGIATQGVYLAQRRRRGQQASRACGCRWSGGGTSLCSVQRPPRRLE